MNRKGLEKFLYPSSTVLVVGIVMAVFGILLLVNSIFLPALLALPIGGLCIWTGWSTIADCKKQLDSLEASGQLDGVIREFASGRPFFKNKLRVGPTYILGKKSGRVLTHSEVRKVYQHVHKTNFVEDRREIRVETADGKIVSVCQIPVKGKGDQELLQVISIMKTMNPGIYIGYK